MFYRVSQAGASLNFQGLDFPASESSDLPLDATTLAPEEYGSRLRNSSVELRLTLTSFGRSDGGMAVKKLRYYPTLVPLWSKETHPKSNVAFSVHRSWLHAPVIPRYTHILLSHSLSSTHLGAQITIDLSIPGWLGMDHLKSITKALLPRKASSLW